MTRFARGNRPLNEAVEGRAQSVHLEHLMIEDWSEPLVPRPYELGRLCTCAGETPCEHVAALAFAVADGIDADPSLLLRWRGCVTASELPDEAAIAPAPEPTVELTDDDRWRAGALPEPRPLRPLPVGAVLKRLGPSGERADHVRELGAEENRDQDRERLLFVIESAAPETPRRRLAPPLFTCSRIFSTMWYFVSRKPSRPRPCVMSCT
jgi:hypothetical protein